MIAVTAATGHLGRLVIESLLARGIPPGGIAALARSPEKAADLAARGIAVRQADYARPETLGPALEGVTRLLLISGLDPDRAQQHARVAEAARAAGVELIAYTSILHAETSPILLAQDHRATEAAIRATGLPFVFLRNSWYAENYQNAVAGAVATGGIAGSAGTGRIHAAPRRDYAEAAAVVLTGGAPASSVLELAGDEGFTMAELAAMVAAAANRPVSYTDMPLAEYQAVLEGLGLPGPYAHVLAHADAQIPGGALADSSRTLSRLLGRPTEPMRQSVEAMVRPLLAA